MPSLLETIRVGLVKDSYTYLSIGTLPLLDLDFSEKLNEMYVP